MSSTCSRDPEHDRGDRTLPLPRCLLKAGRAARRRTGAGAVSARVGAVVGCGVGCVLGLGAADAQPVPYRVPQAPLLGLAQPGTGAADGAEPWSLVVNPAALGETEGLLLGLRHSETLEGPGDGHGFSGRGTGLYAARHLPFFTRFKVGGAIEILRPPIAGQPAVAGLLSLGIAYRLARDFTIGLRYGHLFAPVDAPSYDGLDTVSLGARLRVGRYAALGVVLHDLNAPRPRDPIAAPGQRSYEAELLARPLADERLEIAAGVRFAEETRELWPRFRLWARPIAGLGLGAEASLVYTTTAPLDYRVGIGAQLDFQRVGASLFGLFGSSHGSGGAAEPGAVAFHGGSLALRVSSERYPAVWTGTRRLYKVELAGARGLRLLRLLAQIRAVETDSRAQGVVVLLGDLPGAWGVADEIRDALLRLRAAGKRVFAYGADFSTRDYYVASAAEKIFLDPVGFVRVAGISQGGFFLKDSLEKIGLRAEILRIGDFKSAPEMWTRSEPSEPARTQRQAVVDDLFGRLTAAVQSGRKLPAERVDKLIERGLFPAQRALTEQLIDGIATGEQVEEQLNTLLGSARILPLPTEDQAPRPRSYAPLGVAVIHVDGDLTAGRSRSLPLPFLNMRIAGGDTLLGAIAQAQQSPQVRAVVLRIDSPGGSALLADVLARQIEELRKVKPVICSFGDVAASGGYYIAAPCHEIFTNPSAITGSIGIYGGKVDTSALLGWLGARRATVQRGAHADVESIYRPYTDEERALVQERLQQGYDRFVDVVVRGRGLPRETVDGLGRGRVWTGAMAVTHKLADRTGGLMDAVAAARRRAGLSPEGADPGVDGALFYYPQRQQSLLAGLVGLLPDLLHGQQGDSEGGALADVGLLAAAWRQALALVPGLPGVLALLDDPVQMRLDGASGLDGLLADQASGAIVERTGEPGVQQPVAGAGASVKSR